MLGSIAALLSTRADAADAAQVSLQASLPELAAIASSNRLLLSTFLRSTGRVNPLISFRDGCEELVDKLVRRILSTERGSIRCDAPIEAVLGSDGNATGFGVRLGGAHPEWLRCRSFVSAAPAIAALVQNPPVEMARIPGFPGARLVILPLGPAPGDAAVSLPRALAAEFLAADA